MSDATPPVDDDPEEWGEIAPRVRPEPSHEATAPLAREGSTVYTVRGDDVYYSVGRSTPRIYCALRNWPASEAAKRQADPRRTMPMVWQQDTPPWGWT